MKSANLLHRRLSIFFISSLWFILASCSMLERQIDRTAGGPPVPADTAVSMRLDAMEPSTLETPQMVSPGPLRITIAEAILMTLENNRALVVERSNPSIQKTFEDSGDIFINWWLRSGSQLYYVTYICEKGDEAIEAEEREYVVYSLRPHNAE